MLRTTDAVAIGRFRSADTYFEGADDTPTGSKTMTRFLVVRRLRSALDGSGGGSEQRLAQNAATTARGWAMMVVVSTLEFHCTAADRFGNPTVAELPLGEERLHVIGFSFDGFIARAHHHRGDINLQVVSSTGYTNPSAGEKLAVGALATSFLRPAVDFSVCALLSSDLVALSSDDLTATINTIRDNLFNGRDLRSGLTAFTPEHYWDARDWSPGSPNWTDRVASVGLTRSGRPELYGVQGRV